MGNIQANEIGEYSLNLWSRTIDFSSEMSKPVIVLSSVQKWFDDEIEKNDIPVGGLLKAKVSFVISGLDIQEVEYSVRRFFSFKARRRYRYISFNTMAKVELFTESKNYSKNARSCIQ